MHAVEAKAAKFKNAELLWLAAIVAAAVFVYAQTLRFFWVKALADMQDSLAFLAPFVSAYFTWRKWPEVARLERKPCAWGLALVAMALVMHLAGVGLDISGPSAYSVLICLVGLCLYLHSASLVKVLAFPLALMLFVIPVTGEVRDTIGFPMQLWASGATAHLLGLMHIAVVHSGVRLTVTCADFSVYQFEVVEGCSGMRSLAALVFVTATFAYITHLPVKFKWLLFCLSLPIALVANVVRITSLALVGWQWGEDVAQNIYHEWSSPLLFLIAIGLMFLINWGLEWLSRSRSTS